MGSTDGPLPAIPYMSVSILTFREMLLAESLEAETLKASASTSHMRLSLELR